MADCWPANLKVHICYAVKTAARRRPVRATDDPAMVPVLREGSGAESARNLKPGGTLTARRGSGGAFRPAPARRPDMARIDGRRSFADIHADLADTEARR